MRIEKMEKALFDKKAVAEYLSLSRSYIEKMVSAGKFPKPLRLADGDALSRKGYWRKEDLDNWVAGLKAE